MANQPRRRPPPPTWTRPLLERLTPTVRVLVVIVTLGYFFFALTPPLNGWMMSHLFLGPGLFHGEVWQPVTALFLHARFVGWIFTVIGLWWVGAFIERTRGTRFLIRLLAGAGIVANVVAAGVMAAAPGIMSVRSDGAAFALTAVFVAFARIYGSRPAQIWGALTMRADYFTWILIAFSLLVGLANGDWAGLAGEVAAIGVAFLATGGFPGVRSGRKGPRSPSHARYRVIDGGISGRGKPTYLN